ncbi:MAG: YidC/Oxa1 family membrane protein insertase, partial [Synergistaceae bacterium]|nr:YidC/Oxa1 family membrane protein insertase [Synergistaceae bacterium]
MSFAGLSYAFCVWPFEEMFRRLYSVLYYLSGNYGVSLVLMSLCVTALVAPFMRFASAEQMRERHIQDVLKPQLQRIETESAGAERQRRIQNLYRRYAYHPIYAIRSAFGVLIQVPLLLGAYYMLKNFGAIAGQPFLFAADLSRPDALFFGLNLLPVVMTGINMYSACVTPGFGGRETLQAWIIALLFLLLLYAAPSALLIFWTCNN